jgi:hypothetical protein
VILSNYYSARGFSSCLTISTVALHIEIVSSKDFLVENPRLYGLQVVSLLDFFACCLLIISTGKGGSFQ